MNKLLILVDGSGYLFRAFHALPPLTNAEGMPTGAVYGVLNMLRRLEKMYPDAEVAVFFDPPGKTQRHDYFPDYKANRGTMPEDLAVQIQPLKDVIQAQGYPLHVVPGYEADDVIATVARICCDQGRKVLISTGDKDFAQLVSPEITIVDTMHNKTYDREAVLKKFGVYPEQIVDYLALVGDTADNIPGVPKVGPKTAVKWLQSYGSVEGVIKNSAFISGKVGEYLRAAVKDLPLYKRLVQIDQHVPLPFAYEDLVQGGPDYEVLKEQYGRLGFRSWHKEVSGKRSYAPTAYTLIDSEAMLKGMSAVFSHSQDPIVLLGVADSTEYGAPLGGLACCVGKNTFYIACVSPDSSEGLSWAVVAQAFQGVFQEANREWVFHGAKVLLRRFMEQGVVCVGRVYDVMVMGYVDAGPGRLSVAAMALDYLQESLPEPEEVFGQGAKLQSVFSVPPETCAQFVCSHALAVLRLRQTFMAKWSAQEVAKVTEVYQDVDGPLVKVLAEMENHGVLVDIRFLEVMSEDMGKRLASLEQRAFDTAGQVFNLSSPKQLQEILYDNLGLPVLEKTPTGQPSTSESVLSQLVEHSALPKILLEHRSLAKLKSTYVDALPRCLSPKTGRVHCAFQQVVTATGRLSCQDPNLQNIPIRTEDGRKIRQAFIAAPGCSLVGLDYSQIELRIMAHISQDSALLEAFTQGEDVHSRTASDVFSVAPEAVSSEQRRFAKVINFGLIYGMSSYGLARQLGVGREEAQGYIEAYFRQYPGVKRYMEETRDFAKTHGYVETLLGRRLYLPDVRAQNQVLRKQAERAAINAPMQGTASELIKLSMIAAQNLLAEYGEQAHLLLQVHDELVFEVRDEVVSEFVPKVRAVMESAMTLRVPLLVTVGQGQHWGEIH